jgi:IclR family pca regulon transcriptional regulator
MAELARIRREGYAVNDQELELGLRSIAVPIADGRGKVVAAINIGVAAAVMPRDDMIVAYLPGLRQVQADVRGLI